MTPVGTVLVTIAGALLLLGGALDVFFTILHPDRDGPLSRRINHGLWWLAVAFARAVPRLRREALAAAGPLMMFVTLLFWLTMLVVGFGLVLWPHLPVAFNLEPRLHPPTLWDALYFSGVAFTTVGFGDITPLSTFWKMVTIAIAASGFGLMTASITYVITVFQSMDHRNEMSLRVLADTQGTWHGVPFLARSLQEEGVGRLGLRLDAWAELVRLLLGRLHRFQGLAFYLRARAPTQDPEPMLSAISEVAVGALLLADAPGLRSLRASARNLAWAYEAFISAVVHRQSDTRTGNAQPSPALPEDHARVRRMHEELAEALAVPPWPLSADAHERVVEVAARARRFNDELARFTHWHRFRDEPQPVLHS